MGAAARPFFSPGTGITHARAQECLAQAVWYEAASESEAGQRAVAQVVLNRVAHPGWPSSVCGVVYQGSERSSGCQFSFTCDGSLARRPSGAGWARAQRIASEALSGSVYAPVGLATHYHTLWINPYWAGTLDHIGTIGAHRFYRTRGASGLAGAFTSGYAGLEPVVSGRTVPGSATVVAGGAGISAATTAPVPAAAGPSIAYQFDPSPAARHARGAETGGAAVSAAVTSSNVEPQASTGTIKAEYARAGQWKAQPGSAPAVSPND